MTSSSSISFPSLLPGVSVWKGQLSLIPLESLFLSGIFQGTTRLADLEQLSKCASLWTPYPITATKKLRKPQPLSHFGEGEVLETANVLPSQPESIKTTGGIELLLRKSWVFGPPPQAGPGRTPVASALSTTRGPDLFRPKAQDEEK